MIYATATPWPLYMLTSSMDGAAMVSAAILLLLVIDTIVTAFLLGKYRSVLNEVRTLRAGTAPQPAQQTVSAADIKAAMSILGGGGTDV